VVDVLERFVKKHANEHRQILGKQMDVIVFEHDQLRQNINEKIHRIYQSSSMKEIDEWERQSIDKICPRKSETVCDKTN